MKVEKRENWKSRVGFIFAALGSAVGLGSIWRFPYVVGDNGGAVFLICYLVCLFLIGFPVLIAEIFIGQTTQRGPVKAFQALSRLKIWKNLGKLTILTGLLISSFYGVISGWTLGYLCEAFQGKLHISSSVAFTKQQFQTLSSSPMWTIGFHAVFMVASMGILLTGVRKGIEIGSKIMMPLLFAILLFLVFHGLGLPRANEALQFLFQPDWSYLTLSTFSLALGQAFFTLSLGQGTMVTYGSYLSPKENAIKSCLPVVLINTLIAILMGIAVFTVIFFAQVSPNAGPSLIFETLPIVFYQISGGYALSILFFALITLAAVTSQISALEPLIAYFQDQRTWSRKKAVVVTVGLSFFIGLLSSLSFTNPSAMSIAGHTLYDMISFGSINLLVPLGGGLAVILFSWASKTFFHFREEMHLREKGFLSRYFQITIGYLAPIIILIILINGIVF